MRWILVVLFLYIIPLWLLFKNHKNFKRCSIYGSMYIVAASVIVICNIYISTINKIESMVDYRNYASDEKYKKENIEIESKNVEVSKNIDNENQGTIEIETEAHNIDFKDNYDSKNENYNTDKTDIEIIKDFKNDIYEIERQALIPMRECMPDMKNIEINPSSIKQAKEDVNFAKDKCEEVVSIYENMDIPKLSKIEYMDILEKSKLNVQKAYIFRSKAMEAADKLLNTKNIKYVGEIKEYLRLSDEQIKGFVDSVKELQNTVNK
ncbi:MAG: hypothetical protein ACRDB0_08325 [Paraclostridium sp.]